MTKKVLVCIIATVVAVVACTVAYNLLFAKKTEIAVLDDGTYYGMSVSELTTIKGLTEKRVRDDNKNISMYDYTEDLYGVDASVTYTFKKDFFGSYLCAVDIKAEISDTSEQMRVFNAVCDSLSDYYEKGEASAIETDKVEGTGSFFMKHGDHKPTVKIALTEGVLTVNCHCGKHSN